MERRGETEIETEIEKGDYSDLQLRAPIVGAILVIAQASARYSQGEDKLRPYRK
jgi:hypothetical protein